MTSILNLNKVHMSYFNDTQGEMKIIEDLTIDVERGKFISIIGPSGCGKTTIFNIIAGLLRPTGGDVSLYGEKITGEIGHVAYMLQKDLLLPWLTVIENVILGAQLNGTSKQVAINKASPILEKYGLGGFEKNYPRTLSGGMKQRVALLRTLMLENNIILLDEPLSALDAQTRYAIQLWLLEIWEDLGKTMLLVTHDIDEAVFLSDEVYVLTNRPTRVAEKIEINLPRPRGEKIFSTPEFAAYKSKLITMLNQPSVL